MNSKENSGNSRQIKEGNNKSEYNSYFGKEELMLYVDTSDEILDYNDSDEPEFCLQSDWGVASFDLKPNFWSFENLARLRKLPRTCQNTSKKTKNSKKSQEKKEKIILEEPVNNNSQQLLISSITQNIVLNSTNTVNAYMFLDVSNSFALHSQP